jgi:hypothetical protein
MEGLVEHNTWLFETDLDNCQEVLEEYKSTAMAQPPPVKRRRHAAVEQTMMTTDAVPCYEPQCSKHP